MDLKPIIPFEPISAENIPIGDEWISQIKWDGVRILTYYDGKEIQLFNRKLHERTHHFPEITSVQEYFIGKSVILDGEVIALDENGNPSFHQVMRRDGLRKMERVKLVKSEVPIYYMIFDILYINGTWIHDRPLKERLDILKDWVQPNAHVQIVPAQTDHEALWKVAQEHQLEGIVCKKLMSPYTIEGKDDRWQKVKNYQDLIAVIAGVTYRSGIVNSVLLGLYNSKGQLWYIGHCGTGKLTRKDWKELTDQVESLKIADKPFHNKPERMKDIAWVRPELTVKVQYIEWPDGRTLRQPSIQAFTQTPAKECVFPEVQKATVKRRKKRKAVTDEWEISHPDKPLWKKPSINKQQYIDYLFGIFPYMAPFLQNRLLTVIRYPHGMFGEPFYQKNCPDYAPSFIQTTESEGIQYIVCNNLDTFLWLGNQLAFEFHIPFQTINGNGSPSEIVFDLDPPSADAFPLAIKAAKMIKEVLDSLHLISFVKISGNKGIQIYIPLPDHRYHFDDTRLFTSFIADYLIAKAPESFTIERMKKNRGGRLYIDYIQHAEGKTIIAPYSPRGNPKATVAAPLYWEEVTSDLTIDSFQIPNMLERIEKVGDPFANFFEVKQKQKFDPVLEFLQKGI